jgi:hypothetical protein
MIITTLKLKRLGRRPLIADGALSFISLQDDGLGGGGRNKTKDICGDGSATRRQIT